MEEVEAPLKECELRDFPGWQLFVLAFGFHNNGWL